MYEDESDFTRLQAWLVDLPQIPLNSMPPTSSPTKRRRVDEDQDETPRTPPSTKGLTVGSVDQLISRNDDSQSAPSSRKSRLTPVGHNLAMHFARSLPLDRRPIVNAPQHVQQLAGRLTDLEDKHGILPAKLKLAIQVHQSLSEPIKEYMFASDETDADSPDDGSLEQLDRFVEIRDNTRECDTRERNFHEIEWNETVHSPMLRLVTRGRQDLACRNLTQATVSRRWADLETQDNRIDYGIFVVPAEGSDLHRRILAHIQERGSQVNPLIDIDIDRPLAVSVETKRLAPGVEKADTQLAGFGRCLIRLTSELTVADYPQLVLPLVRAVESAWEVGFMIREKDRVVIYGPVELGSTRTLTNCYRLYKSLTILFTWTGRQCLDWWNTSALPE